MEVAYKYETMLKKDLVQMAVGGSIRITVTAWER